MDASDGEPEAGAGAPLPFEDVSLSRRDALRAAGGAAAGSALVSTVGTGAVAGQERPDFGDTLEGVDGGYEDARGEDEVTVAVGAEGNDGNFAFSPAGLWIDPGTTVIWEWTGEGGGHNVHAYEGPEEFESEIESEEGHTFEHTFEEDGVTEYVCDPHEGINMYGAIAVGEDVPTEAQAMPDFGDTLEGVDGGYEDARGQDDPRVAVGAEGNDGNFAFSPAGLWIDEGATVTWEWTGEGGGHNVHFYEGPETPSSEIESEEGHTFEHTFEEGGIYEYVCEPHEGVNMYGAIAVGDDVPMIDPGDDGFFLPLPTNPAVIAMGVFVALSAVAYVATDLDGYTRRRLGREEGEPVGAFLVAMFSLIFGSLFLLAIVLRLV